LYSSLTEDHQVSIELLTPDYLHTTKENYGFFPDHYVEGQLLFKRNGIKEGEEGREGERRGEKGKRERERRDR
jgi:hypothetical protein